MGEVKELAIGAAYFVGSVFALIVMGLLSGAVFGAVLLVFGYALILLSKIALLFGA